MYSVTASFSSEQQKSEGIYPIDMFVLNASITGADYMYYWDGDQDAYGYQLNASGSMTATPQLYTGLPIKRNQIKTNVQGEIAGVTISIPNVNRGIESVIQNYNYLRGCDVHVISGFAKYLPSGATAYHIGTSADKNAFIKEKVYVDSTTSNDEVVSFTCKPKFALKAAVIPRRKFSRICAWAMSGDYRGTSCDPDGNINAASYPTCDGTLKKCRERGNESRIGAFLGIPRKGLSIL
jgi:lambda family phage minor tail protein L